MQNLVFLSHRRCRRSYPIGYFDRELRHPRGDHGLLTVLGYDRLHHSLPWEGRCPPFALTIFRLAASYQDS